MKPRPVSERGFCFLCNTLSDTHDFPVFSSIFQRKKRPGIHESKVCHYSVSTEVRCDLTIFAAARPATTPLLHAHWKL